MTQLDQGRRFQIGGGDFMDLENNMKQLKV